MTNGPSVDREKLYRMICALSEPDFQKAVSYVSFLRLANVSQGKVLADLLKEVSKPEVSDIEPWGEGGSDVFAEKAKKEPYIASDPEPYAGDTDEFFAPVRSPRLGETPDRPDSEEKPPMSFVDSKPFLEPDEPVFDSVPPDEDMYFADPRDDRQPENPPPAEIGAAKEKKLPSSSFQPDDFFMPVRSERFDQLRRTSEPEGEETPKTRTPAFVRPPDLPSGHSVDLPFDESPAAADEKIDETPIKREPEPVQEPEPVREPEFAQDSEFIQEPEPKRDEDQRPLWDQEPEPEPEREKPAEAPESAPENPNPSEDAWRESLMQCRKVLHLSCVSLAFLFDVSPETLYSLAEGDGPNAEQEALLQYCLEVAKRVVTAEIPRFDLAARRSFPGGDFFAQKLKRQKITGQDLKVLKDAALMGEELRRRPKGATKPFHSFQDTVVLYSTPLYCEV